MRGILFHKEKRSLDYSLEYFDLLTKWSHEIPNTNLKKKVFSRINGQLYVGKLVFFLIFNRSEGLCYRDVTRSENHASQKSEGGGSKGGAKIWEGGGCMPPLPSRFRHPCC